MSENYQLVHQSRRKCEIYWDTGVSKNSPFIPQEPIILAHYILFARMQFSLKTTKNLHHF